MSDSDLKPIKRTFDEELELTLKIILPNRIITVPAKWDMRTDKEKELEDERRS